MAKLGDDVDLNSKVAQAPHLSWAARNLATPNFPAISPKNVRISGTGTLTKVAWSCDAKRLVSCGTEKQARVWTPEKSFELRGTTVLANGHTDIVDFAAWNPVYPDLLCTASSKDQRLVFWDMRSRTPTQSLSLKPKQPTKLVYSPDGRILLVLTKSGSIVFLSLRNRGDGTEEWYITPEKLKSSGTEEEFMSLTWNHVGTTIITGERYGVLSYYTYPELKRVGSTGAHLYGVTCIALDPRAKYVATAGSDSIVNLFDVQSWRVSQCWDCTEDQVNGLDFSHDGEFVAIAMARSLEIWATELGECIHKVTQPSTPCKSVSWHPWKYAFAYGGQSFQDVTSTARAQPQSATVSFFGL